MDGTWKGTDDVQIQKADVYFSEAHGGRYVPRTVLIDLEPGVLNAVRSQKAMGALFNPDTFISAQNGAGNNFAKGYFSEGCELIEDILDQTRKQVEACEAF